MKNSITNIRKILAYNIKKAREEKKLTQLQLAEKAKISLLTIWKIENGIIWTKDFLIEKIATALEISPISLFIKPIENEL